MLRHNTAERAFKRMTEESGQNSKAKYLELDCFRGEIIENLEGKDGDNMLFKNLVNGRILSTTQPSELCLAPRLKSASNINTYYFIKIIILKFSEIGLISDTHSYYWTAHCLGLGTLNPCVHTNVLCHMTYKAFHIQIKKIETLLPCPFL